MPNTVKDPVKERLIELLGEDTCKDIYCEDCEHCFNESSCIKELKRKMADILIANGITMIPESGVCDMSDGYHTFNELYHHRSILFSVLCNMHSHLAWKARRHHDGSMYDGMFIVGINTPEGQATYHCDASYWEIFRIPEMEFAPVWDGHTPEEAIRRIGLLGTAGRLRRNGSGWIPASEPPKEIKECIVMIKGAKRSTTLWYYPNWKIWAECDGCDPYPVTHWMPMPMPPKGE